MRLKTHILRDIDEAVMEDDIMDLRDSLQEISKKPKQSLFKKFLNLILWKKN